MAADSRNAEFVPVLEFTVALAKRAGAIILEGSGHIRETSVKEKVNAVDLVTEWDVKVEQFVRDEIGKVYPTYKFVGEESYSSGERPSLTDDPTFCVDPIDGTTNFIHGFPYACISIGLIHKKKPILGVIYNPFLDQLYSALVGHGAYLNLATKLPTVAPMPLPSLQSALVGVEYGSSRSGPIMRKKVDSFQRLAGDPKGVEGGQMVHSLRSLGSAALNFCMVASGAMDIYWEIGCWPWDVCAGAVIAQEAGCLVSGAKESEHSGELTEEWLNGRKFIVVRAIPDTQDKSSITAQRDIIDAFYKTVEDWEP
jgi:myo-inositol-1(or 4)-monophosphatase